MNSHIIKLNNSNYLWLLYAVGSFVYLMFLFIDIIFFIIACIYRWHQHPVLWGRRRRNGEVAEFWAVWTLRCPPPGEWHR